MSDKRKEESTNRKDSSSKYARGSKEVHSEKDNSTKNGFKPNKKENQ